MRRAAVLLAIAGALALPAVALAAEERFVAELTTEAEVPGLETPSDASGRATVTIDGDEITYDYHYDDLTGDAVAAHIHYGEPGVAGPVILPLAVGPSPVSGTLTEADFTPAEGGPQTFQEALQALRDGDTYVNVHTAANPAGEIRGQLAAMPPTDGLTSSTGSTVPVAAILLFAGTLALLLGVRRFAPRRA